MPSYDHTFLGSRSSFGVSLFLMFGESSPALAMPVINLKMHINYGMVDNTMLYKKFLGVLVLYNVLQKC